jgi:hypothetical protein
MKALTLVIFLFLLSTFTSAESANLSTPVAIQPNQAVIQVKGVVCSFCAYGAEKNLSKLTFLDKSQFGNDGVLVDINTHRITLALQPSKQIGLIEIYEAIKKGGYDPVKVYLSVHGQVSKEGNKYLLASSTNKQVFVLHGKHAEKLVGKGLVQVNGFLNVANVLDIKPGQPIPIQVTGKS